MKALASIALFSVLGLPALASAQDTPLLHATPVNDRPAETFDEIERGLYFAVQGGAVLHRQPAGGRIHVAALLAGQVAQVEIGVDLGERLSLGAVRAGRHQPGGLRVHRASRGARRPVTSRRWRSGATARVRLMGFADSQDVQAHCSSTRAREGGCAMFSPKLLLPESDILVFAGPGVEYYTRLRHFSSGPRGDRQAIWSPRVRLGSR